MTRDRSRRRAKPSQLKKPRVSWGQTLTLEPARRIILGTAISPPPEPDSQSQQSPCHHPYWLTVVSSPFTDEHFLSPSLEGDGHYTFQRKEGFAQSQSRLRSHLMLTSPLVLSFKAGLQNRSLFLPSSLPPNLGKAPVLEGIFLSTITQN